MFRFYVTSHAVEQFQERVVLLIPGEVRREILSQLLPWESRLQGFVRWNGQLGPVFWGKYEDKEYLIPMQMDIEKREQREQRERGILIPTIYGGDAVKTMHWERNRAKGKKVWLASLKEASYDWIN